MHSHDRGTHASSVSGILAHAPELQTPLTLQVARTRPGNMTVNGVLDHYDDDDYCDVYYNCVTCFLSLSHSVWKEKGRNPFYK